MLVHLPHCCTLQCQANLEHLGAKGMVSLGKGRGVCSISLCWILSMFFIILFIGASNAISLSSRCPLWKKEHSWCIWWETRNLLSLCMLPWPQTWWFGREFLSCLSGSCVGTNSDLCWLVRNHGSLPAELLMYLSTDHPPTEMVILPNSSFASEWSNPEFFSLWRISVFFSSNKKNSQISCTSDRFSVLLWPDYLEYLFFL